MKIIPKINITVTAILLLVISFASCRVFTSAKNIESEKIIYPSPPDTARIQFLTSISSSEDISGKQSKFKKFIFGEEKPLQILKPFGVYFGEGKIYVCDIALKALEIIDLKNNKFDLFKPSGKGVLKLPLGCFVDGSGNIYVADGNRRQIIIFDKNGKYINAFGETKNYKPTAVFVADGKIWAANVKNHAVHVYDKKTCKFLFKFPQANVSKNAYLNQPVFLNVTENEVFVSDFGDFKIKIYDKKGKYLRSVGTYGKLPGQFTRPKGIATDKDGNLFVADAAFENVQMFNSKGKLLMHFGGPGGGKGNMSLPAGIFVNYDDLDYFEKFTDSDYTLKYLIIVTNQYGPEKLGIYGRIELKNGK